MLSRIPKLQLFFGLIITVLALSIYFRSTKTHASTITVNAPANGQQFTGNDFDVSGVADANATIVIIRNGLTLTQTRSDSSGNWTAHLTGLPDGNNTITARSIKNSGYGYFLGSTDGGTTIKIHRLQLSDNTIDGDAYPYTANSQEILLVPSPANDYLYQTGSFGADVAPRRFSFASPATPTVVPSYPSDAHAGIGAYSADGTKYYSPNSGLSTVSVIDVASNTITATINLDIPATNINAAPSGLLYVNAAAGSKEIEVIDPTNNTVKKHFTSACANDQALTTTTFSQDVAYPYYFAYCALDVGSGTVLRYSTATDTLVNSWNVDHAITNGIFTLDNSKVYMTSSSAVPNNTGSDKIYVFNPDTGTITKTIQMHAGVLGIFQSPDAQHVYAGTPGNNFSSSGIDIIDTTNNDSVQRIADGTIVSAVTASSAAATLSNVNVNVVLGVKTTAGSLANTGAIAVSATLLSGLVFGSAIFIYYDYRRHKRPLVEADPTVHYTLGHHLKVVTIPLVKYRLSFSLEAKRNGEITRF